MWKKITVGSVEQLNAENHSSRYNDVALSDGEPIHPCAKYAVFSSECDFPEKYSKFQ